MHFNHILRNCRLKEGLTQVQAAQSFGITERQYQRLESGESKPTYDNLINIANYYNVSIDYLTGRTNNPRILR